MIDKNMIYIVSSGPYKKHFMKDINKKDIIQHFLLNLFTILNIEVSELEIPKDKEKKLLFLLKIASIVIANEQIFLNKKPEFFIQEILLNEIIDINCAIYRDQFKKKKVKVIPLKSEYKIKVDKHYFNEAIKYLIEKLLDDTSLLDFDYDEKKKIFYIKHDSKGIVNENPEPLSDTLHINKISKKDITFQLALAILKMHEAKVEIDEKEIKIKLP